MSDWIEWGGGECPVSDGAIVAYRVVSEAPVTSTVPVEHTSLLTGGKLAGNHYYRVDVPDPMSHEVAPYVAECADIIEALNMTFNEGEAFKAIWRIAAARQGRGKPGNTPVYDAEKAAHYGARIVAQARRGV